MDVRIGDIIAPSFYDAHRDIKQGKHTHYWLKGGRGSTKSSFASEEIILGIMSDPNANGIAFRKVGETLRESVFQQLLWAIDVLCVAHLWRASVNPMQLVFLPTGQKILFRGLDKAKKSKSIKLKKGYFKYVWFEELDEFAGMEEIRTVNQSLMRGGPKFVVFYTYNPPKSQRNWVNEESLQERPDRYVHSSTYLEVPPEWLGEQFFVEAEHLKNTKPEAYEHEYLGRVVGTGAEVFTNITIRKISNDEIAQFDHVRRGLDWGYAADPLHYTVVHYDKTRRRLYIFFEIHQLRLPNRKAAELIKVENPNNREVTADSAEPKSIAELYEYGVRIRPAKKGPDSVDYGVKWLQDLDEIVIDPERCPNTAREFYNYELELDANENFKAGFPDKDNHSIDAVRYALEDDMRNVRVM